jgi:hypothetical protein
MGRLLDTLKNDQAAFRVEQADGGYLMIRHDDRTEEFNEIARKLINDAGQEMVVFPMTDGAQGYERLFVISLT